MIYSAGAITGGEGDGGADQLRPIRRHHRRARGRALVPQPGDARRSSTTATTGATPVTAGTDHRLRSRLSGRPSAGRRAHPQHAERHRDHPYRPDRRSSSAPAAQDGGCSAPETFPTNQTYPEPRPAVPRVHHHLSRRDRRRAGLPGVRGRRCSSTPCTAAATPSRSTTAPAASAPRSSPTASASAPWATARSASTRSSSSPPGRWAIPPWWWTCRPTCRAGEHDEPNTVGRTRTSGLRRRDAHRHALHAAHGAKATKAFYPGRSVERLPQLPARSRASSACSTPAPRSTTSTICTPTSGCTRRTATSRAISTARRSARAPRSPPRSPTRAAATSTRRSGDSIFHCHFYPHFAQGMWALWRVHDVLRGGTVLDERRAGRPPGSRALPDGEIAAGTPIPALVPLPGKPMAPLPGATVSIVNGTGQVQITGTGNPGYPFFVPGRRRPPAAQAAARHASTTAACRATDRRRHLQRGPHPARLPQGRSLDVTAQCAPRDRHGRRAGGDGLPRAAATTPPASRTAPATHDRRSLRHQRPPADRAARRSPTPASTAGNASRASTGIYKAADIQDDVQAQQGRLALPAAALHRPLGGRDGYLGVASAPPRKPPEPLFFRANSGDCIEYWLTNLVPNEYKLDDFQVRTPTDILGQHIHLVKFDVTRLGRRAPTASTTRTARSAPARCASASPPSAPRTAASPATRATARSTARWPRPTRSSAPAGRTDGRRLARRADHGPALVGRSGARQRRQRPHAAHRLHPRPLRPLDPPADRPLRRPGRRARGLDLEAQRDRRRPSAPAHDGGPTTWQAVIVGARTSPTTASSCSSSPTSSSPTSKAATDLPRPGLCADPLRRSARRQPAGPRGVGLPDLLDAAGHCPGGAAPPCPEIISAADPGTMSVNYRNEPVALRVRNPATNSQAARPGGRPLLRLLLEVTRADSASTASRPSTRR